MYGRAGTVLSTGGVNRYLTDGRAMLMEEFIMSMSFVANRLKKNKGKMVSTLFFFKGK